MWRDRVGAHDAPMFTNNSYEITRALVSERHSNLRREAAHDRLARRARRAAARRSPGTTAKVHRLPVGLAHPGHPHAA